MYVNTWYVNWVKWVTIIYQNDWNTENLKVRHAKTDQAISNEICTADLVMYNI